MHKIVVKLGSSVVAPWGKLNSSLIGRIVKDILEAEDKGFKAILVSSGAIACGLNKLGIKERPHNHHTLMALSSLGQILLMDIYAAKFKKYKRLCAQLLLTWDDFDERQRFLNARQTLNKLLSMNIVPIINENDAVSFEEIRLGDNDRLSALVADCIGAEELIILSDVDGLINEKGEVIKTIEKINSHIFNLAKRLKDNSSSRFTSGGMVTKLEAAKIATSSGIKTVIANGRVRGVINKILTEENTGTVFLPLKKVKEARKRWIAFSKKIKGRIYIDEGAKEAIVRKGRSLLNVGIVEIKGEFQEGECVEVLDKEGELCGIGIVNYSSHQLKENKRKRLEKEVIHRDNFTDKDSLS